MDAKELRIGNYVNEEVLGDCEVHSVVGTKIQIDVNNVTCEGNLTRRAFALNDFNVYPIPLTEQWLIDFGFFLDEESDTYNLFGKHNEICIEGYLQNEMNVLDVGVRLTNVHQLQNLYFALTNTELIKI